MRILTTPYDLPDLRGRHEYIEVFRGLKCESDPRGLGFAFHRAGAEIAENSHFWMGTSELYSQGGATAWQTYE